MTGDFSDILSVFTGGIRLVVRAKPGLGRSRPPRLADIGDGKRALEVTVVAAAKDGKANQAILRQLAETLGLRKADLAIKSGATGRLKLIEIAGDSVVLRDRFIQWLRTAL